MSADLFAFDTNILFYAADSAAGSKHPLAERLVRIADRKRVVVPLQTLGELVFSIGRKRPDALATAQRLATTLAMSYRTEP